jgi:hypothetical protein
MLVTLALATDGIVSMSCSIYPSPYSPLLYLHVGRVALVLPQHIDSFARCASLRTPGYLPAFFGALIVFETVLCALALAKVYLGSTLYLTHLANVWFQQGVQRVREAGGLALSSAGLLDILVRQALGYYVVYATRQSARLSAHL